MRVIIQDNEQEVARWAACYIVRQINKHIAASTDPYVLGLATGSTPVETYRELIKMHRQGIVSFKNVVTFNMDEYVGLPEDHPQSYHTFMWENLFNHVDILPENVNILNGNAPDLDQECREYEEKIAFYNGINLFLGGVGTDGHLAFNEPFSSMTSRTRVKTLTSDTIAANSRFFDNDPKKVPRMALTVGVDTVLSAAKVMVLATGQNKARALRHGIEQSYNHAYTISALQTHRRGMIVCDDAAAGELKVNTYRYFKEIEASSLDAEKLLQK